MKRLVLFLTISVFLSQTVFGAEEINLTLEEAIAIALRDNRDILLKAQDIEKAKAKIKEAKAELFPSINFTGGWTKTSGYYANKDISQTTTQLTVKQMLYKGGKIINTIKYNEHGVSIAEAVLDKTRLDLVHNAKIAFYTLLLAQEFANINREILNNTAAHLKVIEARYKMGQASQSDILKIKESLASVEKTYEESLNQIETSSALLRNLLYLAEDIKVKSNAEFAYEQREVVYDEAFLKAMERRPEIRQYSAQEEANKKAIEIAKADGRPTIYASWDYYNRSHAVSSVGVNRNWNDHNVVGFTFSWPIFDGWATKAKVEQAIVDLKEAQLMKEKVIKDIALELKNSYISLKNAIVKIKAVESEVAVYQDNLAQINQKYIAGIMSSLDLDDASLKHDIAMFNKKEAIYDYIIAKASLDKAEGGK